MTTKLSVKRALDLQELQTQVAVGWDVRLDDLIDLNIPLQIYLHVWHTEIYMPKA